MNLNVEDYTNHMKLSGWILYRELKNFYNHFIEMHITYVVYIFS